MSFGRKNEPNRRIIEDLVTVLDFLYNNLGEMKIIFLKKNKIKKE